ncbi:unannotated protein [freshwater metagenome]|uniref:Unannotated protein n=1 Tax=freshwater metagenome TaxID=449393 RepID=A0A6J7I7M4_9ZZZZ
MATIEWQQRHDVEHTEEEVERRQQADERGPVVVLDRLATDDTGSDDTHRRVQPSFTTEDRIPQRLHLARQLHQRFPGLHEDVPGENKGLGHRFDRVVSNVRRWTAGDADRSHGCRVLRFGLRIDDVALNLKDRNAQSLRSTVAIDCQIGRPGRVPNGENDVGPSLCRLTVHRSDDVARAQSGFGSRTVSRTRRKFTVLGLGRADTTDALDRRCRRHPIRRAPAEHQHVDQNDSHHEVHRDAADHDDDALPCLLAVHRTLDLVGREFVDGGHAGDVAEPACRNGFEAVFGLAASEGEDLRAEPDVVAANLHAERFRGPHVSRFVQRDRHPDSDGEQHDTQSEHHVSEAFRFQ